ncbi:asparagine--tRNA ligase [bacterium]|nr:asparagine--tRNA ligase [bacterium]
MLIKDILERSKEGLEVDVSGWILNIRNQAENCFITLTDGSTSDPFPIYIKKEASSSLISNFCNGCSVHCRGVMVKSPGKGQEFELLVKEDEIELLGGVEKDYPIMKANVTFDYLRDHAHLRARTKTFSSIYRIRHRMMMATHEFYDREGFLLLDPNIITTSECEGGAGVFQITEKDISVPDKLKCIDKTTTYDWSKDHFGKPVYLTVSSQLQLEALAMSMGRVYTVNKSFRSEHSVTHKHVSEFTHLEIEQCFTSLEDLMNISERFVKFVMKSVLEHNRKDLVLLENSAKFNDALDKNVLERYSSVTNCDFVKIKYADAIGLMNREPKNLSKLPVYGEDVSSEHEKYLTDHFGCPVFLTHWPIAIKSFYMKQLDDGTCESFDLLMPYRVGELIGASQRETSYDKLVAMMDVKGVKREPLKFYTDLRKYGSCPHGGFGLGCDRLLMLLTGVHNIKDVIPFPVSYQNCQF